MKVEESNFILGFKALFRGLALFKESRAVRWRAYIPWLICTALFVFGLVVAFQNLNIWVHSALLGLSLFTGPYFAAIYYLALFLLWPSFVIILVYLIYVLHRIVAAPFYALLAERVLIEQGALPESDFKLGPWLAISARMFIVSLGKTVIFLLLGLGFFILSLIPVLNLMAAFCFFMMMAFDSTDYALEALQFGLRARLRFMWRYWTAFAGLAIALGLVSLVPGLNFLLLPAVVAGGADMVRRLQDRNRGSTWSKT